MNTLGLPSLDSGPTEPPLLDLTIGQALALAVQKYGSREALVECQTGRRWSYADLQREVDAAATALRAMGVSKGDRVGVWSPNCAEWIIAQFATATIGAIQVNVNPAYRAAELAYVLNQAGVRVLITAERFKSSDYLRMIDDVRPDCPSLQDVVVIGGSGWHEFLRLAGDAPPLTELTELCPSDPINIQYTSGTTGFPKGATLSHSNILNNAYLTACVAEFTCEDRLCIPVPFYHCFGMVCGTLAAVTHGACIVMPGPSFEPEAMLRAIERERCTFAYGVPTMFIAALAHPSFPTTDLSSLRGGFTGGAPTPVSVAEKLLAIMPQFSIVYGMTELSPLATQIRSDDPFSAKISSVGRTVPHVETKVIDPVTERIVQRGQPGELCVRGYSVMVGYWDEPDKTHEVLDSNGWLRTGDLAVMDRDGYLSITGRIKDMVIRGGENIYPREVEEFLHQHPDIVEAHVIGVPDDVFGEELMAWLRLRPGVPPLTTDDVRSYCSGKLAHYKVPRYVHVTDEFPMTVTGKIRKVEMRTLALEMLSKGSTKAG